MMSNSIDEIRRIMTPIAEKHKIPAVYLFVSYARGTATADSDIDLLVGTTDTALKSLSHLIIKPITPRQHDTAVSPGNKIWQYPRNR